MQKRIVFLKTVNDAERLSVLNFIKIWQDDSETIQLQTSGSTGKPKLIEVAKKAMLSSALATGEFFNFKRGHTVLLTLSADYIAGKMQIVRALVYHMTLIVAPTSSNPLKSLSDVKINFAAFVPLQIQTILADDGSRSKFEAIQNVIIGGAPLSQQLFNELAMLKNHSYATFGMTETVSHIALKRIAVGNDAYKALPNVKFDVDDRECLIISAAGITKKKLLTNDRVELVNTSAFRWLGRADYTINSGGVKIQPELVEEKIAMFIDQPFYIGGVEDELLGQKVALFIEGVAPSKEKEENLLLAIGELVSKYEKPKMIVYQPRFKRTVTGKIIRDLTQ